MAALLQQPTMRPLRRGWRRGACPLSQYEGTPPQTYFNDDVRGGHQPHADNVPGHFREPSQCQRHCQRRPGRHVQKRGSGSFPQGVHQKFTKALEFEPFLGINGTFPDFDMLQVGEVVHSYRAQTPTKTRLTPVEQQSEFALFCFTGVPLIIGGKLPLSSSANGTRTLALLTQSELLAVHNSSSARASFKPPSPLSPDAELYGWTSTPRASASARYVGVFSAGSGAQTVEAVVRFAEDAGLQGWSSACVRDMVSGEWAEPVGGNVGGGVLGFDVSVEHHGSRSLLITPSGQRALQGGA